MKLALGFLLGLVAQQEVEDGRYGTGGCSNSYYHLSPNVTCKIECNKVQKVGRGKKAGFTWVVDSHDSLVFKLANNKKTKPNLQPKPQKPYIGFIRLDEKFCPAKILTKLSVGSIGLDIGDKYIDHDIDMSSKTLVENKDKELSLMFQFRKNSWHATEAKKNFDVYNVMVSNIADANTTHDEIKTCFSKAFVYSMKSDRAIGETYNDYTKCILYNEFDMEIDWTEEPPTTTTTTTTTTVTTTTSAPVTTTTGVEVFEEGGPSFPHGMGGGCGDNLDGSGDWSGDWSGDGSGDQPARNRRFTVHLNNKITGGQVVEDMSGDSVWKWIALMNARPGDKHRCPGSIINDDWIVTAGHCCDGRAASSIYFVIGEYNKKEGVHDVGQFNVKALQVIVHEDFVISHSQVTSYENDICLVKVQNLEAKKPASCDNCYSSVCLPPQGVHRPAGEHCWVAGWGDTTGASKAPGGSNKLRDVGLNVMSNDYCRKHTSNHFFDLDGEFRVDDETAFCGGLPDRDGNGLTDGGKGACVGDGGSPFVCVDDINYGADIDYGAVLTGMVSWSNECGKEGGPTVFTKMSEYRDWIDSYITVEGSGDDSGDGSGDEISISGGKSGKSSSWSGKSSSSSGKSYSGRETSSRTTSGKSMSGKSHR